MSSDKLYNKIKEAADRHHPAYDEQAWHKMEKLLDEHLPTEEGKKRRIIFFLLFFLLLAGGAFFIGGVFNQQKSIKKSTRIEEASANEKKRTSNTINQKQLTGISLTKENETEYLNKEVRKTNKSFKKVKPGIPVSKTKTREIKLAEKTIKQTNRQPDDINQADLLNGITDNSNKERQKESKKEKVNEDFFLSKDSKHKISEVENKSLIPKADIVSDRDITMNKHAGETAIERDDETEVKKEDPLIVKEKEKKQHSLFFTVSAGPDVSAAGTEKAGRVKGLFGVGAGFNFGDKFTLRTGFYSGRKVYSSSPDAYNPPPDFYTYYPYLEKVDADCKVYEIPLSVSYNFERSSKKYWFASAGISSYLMKEEKYNYAYKYNPGGQLLNKERTIKNENNHLFSVLTLSGGYRYQFTKSLFFMIEPNLKLPLTGVGYGKVKLNSAGIIFSVGITPFGTLKK